MSGVDDALVKHIAELAQIPLKNEEVSELATAFNDTLKVVDELNEIDTAKTEMTHQVTGLVNVTREDKVEAERMFSQEEAVTNAKKSHDGYFVVERVIDAE